MGHQNVRVYFEFIEKSERRALALEFNDAMGINIAVSGMHVPNLRGDTDEEIAPWSYLSVHKNYVDEVIAFLKEKGYDPSTELPGEN